MASEINNSLLRWVITVLVGLLLSSGSYIFGSISQTDTLSMLKDDVVTNRTVNQVQDVQITEMKSVFVEIKQSLKDINAKIDAQNNRNIR